MLAERSVLSQPLPDDDERAAGQQMAALKHVLHSNRH